MMIDLDNLNSYRQIDKLGMLSHLHEFPDECRHAWKQVTEFSIPDDYTNISGIVILGMGGSAIGGDIVRGLAPTDIPIRVQRGYELPDFVDDNTLIIASSYSGNTEETLSAFDQSLKTPSKKLALTTGGILGDKARANNIPLYIIDMIAYKSPPRAAFPHSFISLLGILQKIGVFKGEPLNVPQALDVLEQKAKEIIETVPHTSNPAKQLATKLHGRIPVVYGAEMLSPVAQRWKTQFNENGKTTAFYETFPELNHNAVVGYECLPSIKEKLFVILLHSSLLHPRIKLRYEATADLLKEAGIEHQVVNTDGETSLSQTLNTVLSGDYVSYYLAMLNEADPTEIRPIDILKNFLSGQPDKSNR